MYIGSDPLPDSRSKYWSFVSVVRQSGFLKLYEIVYFLFILDHSPRRISQTTYQIYYRSAEVKTQLIPNIYEQPYISLIQVFKRVF